MMARRYWGLPRRTAMALGVSPLRLRPKSVIPTLQLPPISWATSDTATMRQSSVHQKPTVSLAAPAMSRSAIVQSRIPPRPAYDTITDFTHNHDKIDFTNIAGINASHGVPTLQGQLTGSGNLTLNAHSVAYIE